MFVVMVLVVNTMAQESTKLAHPESVISDGEFLYVTNVGNPLDPTAKDGNGYISKLSLDGKLIDSSLSTSKLNAPKGTAIIRGMLYVADIDRIIGFQKSDGKKLAEINLASVRTNFANDMVAKDDFTLFVSATDVGKVLEVNIRSGNVRVIADVKGANGLAYDKANNRLYTCSFNFENMQGGEIGVISWNKLMVPAYEKLGDVHGAFDGLALLDDHTLIVSDWGALDHPAGFVQKFDLNTKKATKLDWPVINGPADFYFDANEKKLYIPAMLDSKILIQQL
jgi:DNA-binding beta-propeller fold protein YncE